MQLPSKELQDNLTTAFAALQATCKEPEAVKQHWHDWVGAGTWLLIKQCTSLRQAGRLHQCIGQRMQCAIQAALKVDCTACTAQVGKSIVADFAKRNVHEAFHHLKGWYQAAMETQARPCFQTMERQTAERVDLYQRRDSLGSLVAISIVPVEVRDDMPTDGEIQAVVAKLTNCRSAGASHMRAEHLKEWLGGIKLEEDLEMGPNNVCMGDQRRALARLVQAVWDEGKIPLQHGWIVTVLIPKGNGDYRGISLLKPIWKVIEWVMDHWLEMIALHNSLHGCQNRQGTGTAVIEAKLTQ